jgi:hypothetical protein
MEASWPWLAVVQDAPALGVASSRNSPRRPRALPRAMRRRGQLDASGSRDACSTIAPMDPRPRASEPTPARPLAFVAASVAMLGYFLFMAWPLASDLFKGVPPIEQLRRVEGRLVGWRGCHPVGRHSSGEDVTLAGDAGRVSVAIPCVLAGNVPADGKPHRLTVLLQDTRSLGGLVYDIQLDGRTLLAYADERRDRVFAERGVMLAFAVLLVMLLGGVAVAVRTLLRSRRGTDDEDWHVPHTGPDTAPPKRTGDERAAALAMLAAGNSPHAVATVFGVPEAVVAQWAAEVRAE